MVHEAANDNDEIFVYSGGEVPQDVTHVRIHQSLHDIPDRSFLGRTKLITVTFHDGLHSIGDFTFGDCTSLQKLKIPPGTAIGNYAFAGCINLTDVELGEGVDMIGTMAFYRCTSLININFPPTPREESLGGSEIDEGPLVIIGDTSDKIWKRSWQRNRMLLILVALFFVIAVSSVIGAIFSSKRGGGGTSISTSSGSQCIVVNVTLDEYPVDTSWIIKDLDGGKTVATSIPYNESAASSTLDGEEVCLSNGDYNFTIFDVYGDGICCSWGEGSYTVSTTSGLLIASGGEFEGIDVTTFSIPFTEGPAGPTKQPSLSSTSKSPVKPTCTSIEISITLDDYPLDITWQIVDSTGKIVAKSPPYNKSMARTKQSDKVCLPDRDYRFTIFDAYEDGLCCKWGEGGYFLRYLSGREIINGGEWLGASETKSFTIAEGSAETKPIPPSAQNKPTISPTPVPSRPPSPVPITSAPTTTTTTTSCTAIVISVTLDKYPVDTSWEVLHSKTGGILANSSSYDASLAGLTQEKKLCLPPGSYSFVIYDEYEDGMCCEWGEGSYSLMSSDGDVIATGSQWTGPSETKNFTIT
jgi:hypothetical protein